MLTVHPGHCVLHGRQYGSRCQWCGAALFGTVAPEPEPHVDAGPFERYEVRAKDATDYAALVVRLVRESLDDAEVLATLRALHARLPAEQVEALLLEARARLE